MKEVQTVWLNPKTALPKKRRNRRRMARRAVKHKDDERR
jgi:hypothetical protein